MKTIRKPLLLLSCLPALALAACGEGWEVVPFHGQAPYTDERTAGSGVAYVRAMLLPERGPVLPEPVLILEPQMEESYDDAAPLFTGPQLKK